MNKAEIKCIDPEYVHSSNALFNFMDNPQYLEDILNNKGIAPRYCEENIEYLNLYHESELVNTVSVLQKCFCDIPLHNILEKFPIKIVDDMDELDPQIIMQLNNECTHTDFYGKYGIAFPKTWAQEKNLQPVQYINRKSKFVTQFKNCFEYVIEQENIDDLIVSDIILRLSFFKPLYGEMTRQVCGKRIGVLKNFHDECEWRFVPEENCCDKYQISPVIFNKEIQRISKEISNRLAEEKYRELWLNFEYRDIRYLIVPDNDARIRLINFIGNLHLDNIEEKNILISKIIVLEDIKRDF